MKSVVECGGTGQRTPPTPGDRARRDGAREGRRKIRMEEVKEEGRRRDEWKETFL